ncbi:hypothetical protein PCANC_04886 [Puccinia coronata f. sp. avenae]|uniref:Uncharacterized protein n=1 Tax=Puccinia coronata f. sp. avenae TaxID=200324 RepID=A0A2N5W2J8_9BASI|nr:hypothetical protein PCANC_04886 [Puccinia coronata f. sp. avenae]
MSFATQKLSVAYHVINNHHHHFVVLQDNALPLSSSDILIFLILRSQSHFATHHQHPSCSYHCHCHTSLPVQTTTLETREPPLLHPLNSKSFQRADSHLPPESSGQAGSHLPPESF